MLSVDARAREAGGDQGEEGQPGRPPLHGENRSWSRRRGKGHRTRGGGPFQTLQTSVCKRKMETRKRERLEKRKNKCPVREKPTGPVG